MSSSRLKFKTSDDKPHNSSRGKGLILETPYRPGFVDDKDLETVKMAVDKELSEISNAFYETTERTADTITRIERLEIGGGTEELRAMIEEVEKVSIAGDVALAEKITTLKAESEAGDVKLEQEMSVVSDKTGKLEAKWGIQMDVNGKVSGVSMNNDGATSEFNIVADKFRVSDGTKDLIPFEVVGPNTRIKSALVEHIQSDNWDGVNGWAINNKGDAIFRNGEFKGDVRAESGYFKGELQAATGTFSGSLQAATGTFSGTLQAASGTFAGDISGASGTFTGKLNIQDQGGKVGMKITNNQILIYDEQGRLRVKMGRL